jgi:hypothetical protein
MPRPPHSPRLDLPNDIWGLVQIMKFLIVQLPPFSRHRKVKHICSNYEQSQCHGNIRVIYTSEHLLNVSGITSFEVHVHVAHFLKLQPGPDSGFAYTTFCGRA